MNSLRARLNAQAARLHAEQHGALPTETAADHLALAERLKAMAASPNYPRRHGLVCWLCNEHMQPCERADCPKVWRLKDAPKMDTEGRSGRHDVGGRK